MTENIDYYRNQIALARTEIKNLRQQILSLKHEHIKETTYIKSHLSLLRCANCGDIASSLVSNHNGGDIFPLDPDFIAYKRIGYIETPFRNKTGVPRQPTVLTKAKGAVVIDTNVFNNPDHALIGLEEFSHLWILFHFHMTESTNSPAKVAPPRLRGERRGVFSTRSPHRPCPIGLSLVKIESIEGNKINFLGVDMVNGTPVLDIKPYIPEYDYPAPAFRDLPMSSLVRPPTEGISDVTDTLANLPLGDRRVNPRVNNVGSSSNPSPRSAYEDDSSPELASNTTPITPSSDSPSVDNIDGNFRTPAVRRADTERGAPDGQERYTPPQSAHLTAITHDGIRVAPWISNPPSQRYDVRFNDDALQRLNDLIGDRAPTFKSNIECLLSEDPRSQYVRNRYPDHEYSCVLEDLSISCVFNASTSVCTIMAVRNAEDLQT
ncbi:unnamed protein product [Chrysodeixis includens]|uniref:TsaA-like domain-containing protein n=1 Tax=Chrysodeixis includens TaxID=689277 RepID=A0A9P0BVF5_CHRIL|nr:unnamed protein product [Chrysodeixis includens]